MTPVPWMIAVSAASWLAAAAVFGARAAVEILLGMLAPLTAAIASWMIAARTFRRDPARLTAVMITAFGAKMLFFGTYVAVMLAVVSVRPVPFVASFTLYYIGLHLIEALCLRRLFQ
jgi:hypothetical protein